MGDVMITKGEVVAWLRATASVMEQNKVYLTDLDAAIGDADHGVNMDRGFRKVAAGLEGSADGDIGTILKGAGMALIGSVGGAGGPLYGTFFMRAATIANGKEELNAQELGDMLQAGLDGVVQRGKAQVGEKTMVDALTPAVNAYRQAAGAGTDAAGALRQAVAAAEQGVKDTVPLVARKGRASYLGERSKDHQDPGATSSYLMLKALSDIVTEKEHSDG
jgi:phosphoenolpyruvate---glycerone phosphotransferase subunit DhaL